MSQSLQKVDIWGDFALPAEETEKFIAEKKDENKPVEEITVKKLREEVAEWRLFSFQKERKAVILG